jgi:formylglycine-generating enzyme required for sulfatase activity
MDVHPVWNAAYAKFIGAGGYENPSYWTEEGWAWMVKSKITQPAFWKDSKWNQPFQPVVGVSYYEAEAYGKWAGKRLPTEEEWEKAARGTDGRIYPWGNELVSGKCNSEESNIRKTTPIGTYPQGKSPFGCQDMTGNVWEWCASWYEEADGGRVIRGGSWLNEPVYLRASYRFRGPTVVRGNYHGFRLAQDIP